MPRLSPGKLPRVLAGRPPAAVFFLHGDEEFLRERAVDQVVATFLDPATRDFNLDQLNGADVTPEALASVLATPPMMAEHRVVVLRDAQSLTQSGRLVVENVSERPPAGLVLVVSASIPSGSKAKFYSALHERATSVEFKAIDATDLPGWVIERARQEHSLEMDLDAARALCGAIGAQLGVLATELEKLASYVEGRKRITAEDVRAVGGYIPRADRWGWFDLVAEQRFDDAFRALPDLLDSGESGVGLVIGMTNQLLRVGLGVAGGTEALQKNLRSNQRWLAGRLAGFARLWSQPQIEQAISELLRTDRLLKSASLTDEQALQELILRLRHLVESPRRAA